MKMDHLYQPPTTESQETLRNNGQEKQEYDYVKCSLLNRTKLMHTSIHTVAVCHTLDLHKVKPVKIPAWMSSNCQLMVVKGGDKLVLDLWPLIGCLCSSKWCPKHSHMVSTTWTEWAIKDYFFKGHSVHRIQVDEYQGMWEAASRR